jgi:hypothetical protein
VLTSAHLSLCQVGVVTAYDIGWIASDWLSTVPAHFYRWRVFHDPAIVKRYAGIYQLIDFVCMVAVPLIFTAHRSEDTPAGSPPVRTGR